MCTMGGKLCLLEGGNLFCITGCNLCSVGVAICVRQERHGDKVSDFPRASGITAETATGSPPIRGWSDRSMEIG